MGAFWLLFLLAAYGVFGGFIYFANDQLKGMGVDVSPWQESVPLIGDFGPGALAAVILQLLVGLILLRILGRPRSVAYLAETELEMRKVVWPSWKDTRSGSVAVIITVTILLFYLLAVDAFFLEAFSRLFQLNRGG